MNEDEVKKKSDLCLECLACCKRLAFICPISDYLQDPTFWQIRCDDIKFLKNKETGEEMVMFIIDKACKLLSQRGLMKGCLDYENRPKSCRLYDGSADPGMKGVCKWEGISNLNSQCQSGNH